MRRFQRFPFGGVLLATGLALQGSATTFGQATSGDLDGNHEVSLSDVTGFVSCLTGPDDPSNNPACIAAVFDADDDVDLRDVAAFQNRFGLGVGPPRIDRFSPTPGTWIVDDIGLTQIQVGFTEPVVVPDGSIDVWVVSRLSVNGGDVTNFTTSYDDQTFMLMVAFAEPLKDDRITIVVDYSIEDLGGNPLDGEIYNPQNAVLPSGNGVSGGQGVFRIHVLQGDANRDGIVDMFDLKLINEAIGVCSADPGFDPRADLNSDGCVDAADENFVTAALDHQLTATDGMPLSVESIAASGDFGRLDTVRVRFIERVNGSRINARSCFIVKDDRTVIVPMFGVQSGTGFSAVYTFVPELPSCDGLTINVSNSLTDLTGELLVAPYLEHCP